MTDFEQRFLSFWPTVAWNDLTVVAAVSGGADSVALLRAMLATRSAGLGGLVVAHLNHHWRGDRSEADARFVQSLANRFELPCEIGSATFPDGASSEESARRARYSFLQATAEKLGARYVAMGHTADDQAETVLHRILRGTGISGLAGIPRTRQLGKAVTVIRPMLSFRRHDVESYLASLDQTFCQDDTNLDKRFTRNRIRHELIPSLERHFNLEVVTSLTRLGQLAGEAHDFLTSHAEQVTRDCVIIDTPNEVVIDRKRLSVHHTVVVREFLMSLWRRRNWPRQGMGFDEWRRLAEMVTVDTPAAYTLPGRLRVSQTPRRLRIVVENC